MYYTGRLSVKVVYLFQNLLASPIHYYLKECYQALYRDVLDITHDADFINLAKFGEQFSK